MLDFTNYGLWYSCLFLYENTIHRQLLLEVEPTTLAQKSRQRSNQLGVLNSVTVVCTFGAALWRFRMNSSC